MKNTITVCLMLLALFALGQERTAEFGAGYVFSLPRGIMSQTIRNAHGVALDFYVNPKGKKYLLGVEMGIHSYGHDKTRQNYTFDDGTTAAMDITVSNTIYNMLLGGRYYLGQGRVQPFIGGKIGYSLYNTQLVVTDPDDFDSCEPVDSDVLKNDGSLIFSAGAGLQLDLRPKARPGFVFINLSANYLSGDKVDYMNVDAPAHSHAAHTSDVYTRFINTQTQIVHEHHVGNVYSSVIESLDFRLGVMMRLVK
jgi:hypothetical protein